MRCCPALGAHSPTKGMSQSREEIVTFCFLVIYSYSSSIRKEAQMYDNIIYVSPLKRDTFGEAEKKINDTALFAFWQTISHFFPKKRTNFTLSPNFPFLISNKKTPIINIQKSINQRFKIKSKRKEKNISIMRKRLQKRCIFAASK